MAEITYLEAIREALIEEMERDDQVFCLGEDIAAYGGAFKATDGLVQRFGEQRVLDTPISEIGIVGAAAGAAHMGMRPIVEMQFIDFIANAYDMLTNYVATARYRAMLPCPMVVRGPSGGYVRGGPFHSQNPEAGFVHTPGLKVVYPATAEDAKLALEHGVDWIYVSNHGGRQLDHGRGAMDVLPEVVEAAAGRAKVIVDGAFARGTDIVKAIAAGATLVGLGRLQCYALAAGGRGAIVRLLELLEDEVQRCLGLLGVTRFADLNREHLHPAPSPTVPDVFSAFPLLKIDDYQY